jgi:hypothetical protein
MLDPLKVAVPCAASWPGRRMLLADLAVWREGRVGQCRDGSTSTSQACARRAGPVSDVGQSAAVDDRTWPKADISAASSRRGIIQWGVGGGGMDERRRISLAWADFSCRVRWSLGWWIGGFFAMAVTAVVADLGDAATSGLFVAWSLGNIATSLRVLRFRCPHCGGRFLGPFWRAPQRCQHCCVIRGR